MCFGTLPLPQPANLSANPEQGMGGVMGLDGGADGGARGGKLGPRTMSGPGFKSEMKGLLC